MVMKNINDVCDYVIFRLTKEGGASLSHLKLQKLLYYIQSWNLAFDKVPLFQGKFQAWIHGPVNRTIYNRFKDTKYMYSSINTEDIITKDLTFAALSDIEQDHINSVLEAYAAFSDVQLEKMTHEEKPWLEARDGFQPYERCEVEIDESTMTSFYAARL
jgi:uncharacterized phage-associated protein